MHEQVHCIYCGAEIDPTAGEGDHVIPRLLGEFPGDRPVICSGYTPGEVTLAPAPPGW
ncbi:MAG TPA: hypothetical protein VGB30_04890 [bacterium]|jgi:hypothetical protein